MIGVQHSLNYWGAVVGTASETGRVFVTASVTRNTFQYDPELPQLVGGCLCCRRQRPGGTLTPPTITIGAGFSAEAPGPYGSPRFPWTVGNTISRHPAATFRSSSTRPRMWSTVQGNSVELFTALRPFTPESALSGQVYDGIVNGAVDPPRITPVVLTD